MFEWYWIPGIVSSSCIIALAVGYLIDAAAQTAVKFLHLPRIRPVVIGVLLLLVLSLSGSILAYKASRFEELQAEEDLGRRPAGEYLARCTVASARVMLEPIGYIGFFSDREIIDLAGLVTPEFAAVAQKQSPGWMMGKIRQVKPEYILLRAYEIKDNEFFASGGFPLFEGPEDRAWFMNNYRETVTFGPGKSAMVVWRRSDVVSACLD